MVKERAFLVSLIILSVLCAFIRFGSGAASAADSRDPKPNVTWTPRVITEKELANLSVKDMDLSPDAGLRILAKLNARDFDYIAQDIGNGRPIKVPNDFPAFKNWTPLE
ncbi:MAG TPA: hypothetical protein VEF34_03400 [Syntrophobacteraceae bacterium]|nr:hypothetical protein [Syntrophobacteraceae bacterium]